MSLKLSFIIPVYNKRYSIFLPFVGGLFFYNIFYQVILEPIFWFVIFLYYYDLHKELYVEK